MNHDEQLSALEKQMDELETAMSKVLEGDSEKPRERYRPEVSKAKKKADESDDDESDYSDLEDNDNDEDDMDTKAKKAAPEELKEEVKAPVVEKTAEADESVTIAGQTISKAAVGPAMFAVMKSQAEELAKAQKEINDERDLRKMAEFKKRAAEEFASVPGSNDDHAEMLKALEGMSEDNRKRFTAVMTSAQKLAKTAFDTLGTAGGAKDAVATAKSFETKVAEIAKRDSLSKTEAMAKARTECPDEFEAYQASARAAN